MEWQIPNAGELGPGQPLTGVPSTAFHVFKTGRAGFVLNTMLQEYVAGNDFGIEENGSP